MDAIFLDIDGVMFDWKYRLSSGKKLGGVIKDFNPESVKSLNFLCDTLSKQFNTSVVITSTWKQHWDSLLEAFDSNGVDLSRVNLSKTITREDIMNVARKVKLNTIYLLKGEDK